MISFLKTDCEQASIVFLLISIGIAVIATVLPFMCIGNRKLIDDKFYSEVKELKEKVGYVLDKRNFFLKKSVFWMMISYALSLLAVICNVLVIYLSAYSEYSDDANVLVFTYSALSLCLTVIAMAINPFNLYRKFRSAFRVADNALNKIEYELSSGKDFEKRIEEIILEALCKSEDEMDER